MAHFQLHPVDATIAIFDIAHSILYLYVITMIIFLQVSVSVRGGNGALATVRMRAMKCVGRGAMWTTTPAALTRSGGMGGSSTGTAGCG